MGRPRTRTTSSNGHQAQTPPGADLVELVTGGAIADDDPEPDTALDRLAAAIEAHGNDAKAVVKIYRVGKDQALTWCEDLQPEAFERTGYAGIREKWGAGTFRVRLMGTVNGKAGKPGFGIRAQELIDIAQDMSAAPIAAAAAPAAPAGLEAVLASIAETQRTLLETITKQQPNPMGQMLQMMTLAKAMREAFGPGESAKPASVLEVLKEMRALKELGGDLLGATPAEQPDMLTAALPQLLELVKEAGRVKGSQPPAPGLPVPAVAMPASIADAQPGVSTVPDVNDPQQLLAMLTKNLNALVALASTDQDPEVGATIVYENLPDELLETLRSDASWFDQLSAMAPQVAPHRAWLEEVRTIVLAWMAEDEAGDAGQVAPGGQADAAPTA